MDQAPFIVRPSKGSKSSYALKQELFHSQHIHADGTPLLASSLVLRSRGMGQIDICRVSLQDVIEIFEVKSSSQGCILSFAQRQRLQHSLHFLTLIFNISGRIKTIK